MLVQYTYLIILSACLSLFSSSDFSLFKSATPLENSCIFLLSVSMFPSNFSFSFSYCCFNSSYHLEITFAHKYLPGKKILTSCTRSRWNCERTPGCTAAFPAWNRRTSPSEIYFFRAASKFPFYFYSIARATRCSLCLFGPLRKEAKRIRIILRKMHQNYNGTPRFNIRRRRCLLE